MIWNGLEIPDKNLYHVEDAAVIYYGDCREILPDLPKVDLVLTDPPYGIGKAEWDSEYPEWCENLAFSISETVCIMVGQWNLPQCIKQMGDRYTWMYAGYKPAAMTRGKAGINKWLPAVVGGKVINRGCDAKQFHYYIEGEKHNEHPSQKPLAFVRWLISELTAHEGNTLLDPFLGSGTTAVAAKQLGRKCIGIEISEKYCEIAVKRLQQSVMNLDTPQETKVEQQELL